MVITTFNREKYIERAIANFQAQTYTNKELIIVDDHSQDQTQFLVHKLIEGDLRCSYIRNKQNLGLSASRNVGIDECKGKYFTFCDDDDLWKNTFIESFVKIAENYDDNWCFTCGNIYFKRGKEHKKISNYETTLRDIILEGFTPPVASQFYHLSYIKEIGGYNTRIKSGVDHDLWLRLCSKDEMMIKHIGKALSYPNCNYGDERITTNMDNRKKNIMLSLKEWKPEIIEIFGLKFYYHFKRNYKYYLIKKEILQKLRSKKYLDILNLLLQIELRFLIDDFWKSIKKKLFQYEQTPLFKKFKN